MRIHWLNEGPCARSACARTETRRRHRLLVLLLGALAWWAPVATEAATFTVDDAGDAADAAIDGTCATAGTVCTLRAAIQEANATAALDDIDFNIPGGGPHTISPGSALPTIVQPVAIDGYTEPGASQNTQSVGWDGVLQIELDGSGAGAGVDGLLLSTTGCTVRGLVIHSFSRWGIYITGGGSNTIEGNFVGTDVAGSVAQGNGSHGINIDAGSTSNQIGGTAPSARNLVSGNAAIGILISGAGTDGNIVEGNYAGTDAAGVSAIPNIDGIVVANGPTLARIGGTAVGSGNLTSGNGRYGIRLANSNGNTVQGNRVGTDAPGTAALPNNTRGVLLAGADSNLIGGAAAGAGNLISGNTRWGLEIFNSDMNMVEGNLIGTDVTGTMAIPNNINTNQSGVILNNGSTSNTIGGTAAGAGNVVSGNVGSGIDIVDAGTSNNVVAGNLVGTDISGANALANGKSGIVVFQAGTSNVIGGLAAGAGNVVAGHPNNGIAVDTSGTGSQVLGNVVGADASATVPLPNGSGVRLVANSVLVQQNRVLNNTTGIELSSGGSFATTSDDNCIVFNGAGANNTTGVSTTFTNNWWGSVDGPSGAGPGSGDSVSIDVVFSPFLTTPPAGCPTSTGVIEIVKDAQPDGPQDFPFSGGLGAFSLDDDADPALQNSATFVAAPGTYAVTEAAVAGFTLTALVCGDPSGDTTTDLPGRTATIQLSAAETVSCTFVNSQDGTITIVKDTVPDGPQDFAFTGDLGDFTLDDDADATLPNSLTFSAPPGDYAVVELGAPPFGLTGLTCLDPTGDTAVDLASQAAMIALGTDEAVVCTFGNTEASVLEIPTLNHVGVILLSLLLVSVGVWALRRRMFGSE